MSLLKIAELQGQLSRRDARIAQLEAQPDALRQRPALNGGICCEPLTDDEIDGVGVNFQGNFQVLRDFARAILDARDSKERLTLAGLQQGQSLLPGYADAHYGTRIHSTPRSSSLAVHT